MQCYTELAPPTAVSHAVTLPFVSSRATNLVVAKNSLLQVFELRSTVTEVAPGEDGAGNAAANFDTEAADVQVQRTENTAKLVLLREFPSPAPSSRSRASRRSTQSQRRRRCWSPLGTQS